MPHNTDLCRVRIDHVLSAVLLHGAHAVSGYGLPDIGLVTGSEMVDRVALVVEASGLPVIAQRVGGRQARLADQARLVSGVTVRQLVRRGTAQ